jgi:hypothetical protein
LLVLTSILAVPIITIPVHAQTSAKIAVNPAIITGLNYLPGQTVTFSVNLTNSPSFNSFVVSIMTDNTILNPLSATSGGIFDNLGVTLISRDCVNGAGLGCALSVDRAGVVTFGEALLGAATSDGASGTLFRVTFNVTGTGASQIHILQTLLGLGINTSLAVPKADGSFANKDCSPGVFCKPAKAIFTTSTNGTAVNNVPLTFDASNSTTPNLGAAIASYDWVWGDGSVLTTGNSKTSHDYQFTGNFLAVLRVTDSDGVEGFASAIIKVTRVFFDLAISRLDFSPSFVAFLGDQVNITAEVDNLSTQPENATVSIMLENTTLLAKKQFPMPLYGVAYLLFTWNTSRLNAGFYQIEARVDPIRNNVGQIIENVTSNDIRIDYFGLLKPAQQPIFVENKLSYDHHLSFSQNSVQTWTATVANPNLSVDLLIGVGIGGPTEPPTGNFFFTSSHLILLRAGQTLSNITLTFPFASSDVGLRYVFIARINWGGPSEPILLETSSSVKTGSFTIGR